MSLTEFQQEYLNNCNHRWNVKTGATGSGKSYVDYAYTIPKRITSLKGEGLAVMMGNTRGTLERNIIEPMREMWGEGLVGNIKSDNTLNIFGRKVYALGADNKKHIARIQGATFEYVYGDEVTTWEKGVFEMLKSRLRCAHSVFDGTCNPDSPLHWFKQFLDSGADIYCQKYIIDDGCLPPHIVEELKKEYAGTVFYNRYILGQWVAAEGLIYDAFNPDVHVLDEELPTEGPLYVSSDFGIANANVFLLWRKVANSNKWVLLNEYYYSGRESMKQRTVSEHVQGLVDLLNGEVPKQVIVDPSALALIAELRKRGYKTRGADNDVLNGIADTGAMIAQGRLLVMRRCKNTIREFGTYSWDEKAAERGEDKPIKESDHCADAVRYFVRTMKLCRRESATREARSVYLA